MGALAGMRSLSAPALLSRALLDKQNTNLSGTPFRFLQHRYVANTLTGLAATELLGDKLPIAPDRIETPSLLMRAASGAAVGAAVFAGRHKSMAEGAALGAVAAVAATYASFYLRKFLCEKTGIADPVFGALEDVLVVASGLKAAKAYAALYFILKNCRRTHTYGKRLHQR
ncbi:putative membrane protein [Pontibacter mucosus]|uniref:Putative membrane protein n=2 Tax=Pontibacter mucosus TaxID=1649266 RepID=A0A2T5YG82_9BACT|nr:putative membrane protein [Pontibacter mucosus]